MKDFKCRPIKTEDTWVSTKEAATYLGITSNALRIMVHRSQVPYSKLRTRLRFKRSALDLLLEVAKE